MAPLLPITQTVWFELLPVHLQRQSQLSFVLYKREVTLQSTLEDYSFVVFPLAKAYEGFLKHYFFQRGLIDEATLHSKRFRIGRSLNPDLPLPQRNEKWLYDDVARSCSAELARGMWDTWLTCRNRVFHYFPDQVQALSLDQANKHLQQLIETMEAASFCPR